MQAEWAEAIRSLLACETIMAKAATTTATKLQIVVIILVKNKVMFVFYSSNKSFHISTASRRAD